MRRGTRIATSAAAAGAIMAGAGAALATIPHSGHAAAASNTKPVSVAQAAGTDLTALEAQALANQRQVAALQKAIAKARANIEAQAKAAAERAAAQRAAAAVAAAQAAQAARTQHRPTAPSVQAGTTRAPEVHTNTGASGAGGGSDDDHGQEQEHEHEHESDD